jgi:hypothetical protein
MKLKTWVLFMGAALVGLVAGCAPTTDVRTDYQPGTDFSIYKTFSLAPDKIVTNNPFAEERIRRAIATQLTSKGLRQIDSDGDLIVHAHARLRVERQVQVWNSGGWGYRGAAPTRIDVNDVPLGTVVVDLVDRAKGELAWRGIAQGMVNPQATTEESEQRINGAMAELFKDFPPGH